MGTKHPKEKNKENISSNKKTSPMKQQKSHPTRNANRPTNGWFTEEDAKIIKEAVIGRFYRT